MSAYCADCGLRKKPRGTAAVCSCKPPEEPYKSMTCIHCGIDAFCPTCDEVPAPGGSAELAAPTSLGDPTLVDWELTATALRAECAKLRAGNEKLRQALRRAEKNELEAAAEADELTVQVKQWQEQTGNWRTQYDAAQVLVVRLVEERDELRAKLAEVQQDAKHARGSWIEMTKLAKELEAKLADALNGGYCPQCGDAGLTGAGAEALEKLTEPLRAKLAEAEKAQYMTETETCRDVAVRWQERAEAAESRVKELTERAARVLGEGWER